jgi:hypothetical protein
MEIRRKTALLGLSIIVCGCATSNRPTPPTVGQKIEPAVRSVAIGDVAGQVRSQVSGKEYRFFFTEDAGAQTASREFRLAQRDAALSIAEIRADDSNVFKGHARAEAKTTLAHARIEKFKTLADLVAAIPTDDFMLNYEPPIDRDTPRVAEESRNVAVCAWIVATKREDDNDYHVMLSDASGEVIFNAEMSGIPATGNKTNRRKLLAARVSFETFVSEDGRKTGNYTGWGDPVPVYIEGSLFYDTEHRPGAVGPSWARPKSSWEIHPISKILFEPSPDRCP